MESITSISGIDSQLKHRISALIAASISLSLFPTPAKTIPDGLKPVSIAL
jgi:hypothetical protein